jgi:acetyl esterase/lipase
MVSEGMERVITLLRQFSESASDFSVEYIRQGLDQLGDMVKLAKDVKCTKVDAAGVPSIWISTPDVIDEQVILYLHGGGYVAGSIKSHENLAARLSRLSKSRVLLIDYRLAPEHVFPAAIEDSTKAYRWLVSHEKILPKNMIIGGDSAGGGLTIATLVKLRDEGDALPAAAVCLSPWTDLAITGDSVKTNADIDPFVPADSLELMAKEYYGDEDPKNPLVSPLYANLEGLPPLLIQVGTAEVLLDDSVRVAKCAKEAGVEVQLEIWQDMIHVFSAFAEWAPEGQQGIEQIGEFIQKHIQKEYLVAD